jgi:tetratricopeptide (TPR) repeat protein
VRAPREHGRLALAAAAAVAIAALGLGALLAGAAAGQPRALTREEALAHLGDADQDTRRQAVASLGEVGLMADVPRLVQALRDRDAVTRALAHNALWRVWSRSGDPEVDRLFAIGLEQMTQGFLPQAVETFTRIIEQRPDFAEGWNKRATLHFLLGDYERSLRDCDEVVKRNPYHFGALAGYGQIYLALGRPERALPYFERALAVNPTLEQVEAAVAELRQRLIRQRQDTI